MVCLIPRWSLGEDVSFRNVETKIMIRNSSASLSFKLETTESTVGRGNWEAVAGVQCHSWGGRPGKFGGEENQAGQVLAFVK